jgi:hypothetical protein
MMRSGLLPLLLQLAAPMADPLRACLSWLAQRRLPDGESVVSINVAVERSPIKTTSAAGSRHVYQ